METYKKTKKNKNKKQKQIPIWVIYFILFYHYYLPLCSTVFVWRVSFAVFFQDVGPVRA